MRIRELMTPDPTTCEPTTSLRLVAQLMNDHDCAAIPIVRSGKVVGIVTDRDIACRCVARGRNAAEVEAGEIMSSPVIAVRADDAASVAIVLMEENCIHHLPVVKDDGTLIGIVAQADLGRCMTNREFGALARSTSIRSPHFDLDGILMRRHDH